jgi:hypothetical protein
MNDGDQELPSNDITKTLGSIGPQPPGIVLLMIEKPLTMASLNVRGLKGNTPKPKEIKA